MAWVRGWPQTHPILYGKYLGHSVWCENHINANLYKLQISKNPQICLGIINIYGHVNVPYYESFFLDLKGAGLQYTDFNTQAQMIQDQIAQARMIQPFAIQARALIATSLEMAKVREFYRSDKAANRNVSRRPKNSF